jgi:hypothetical protein
MEGWSFGDGSDGVRLDLYMYADRWVFMRIFLDLLYLTFMYVVNPCFIYTSLPSLFLCSRMCTLPDCDLDSHCITWVCRLS